VTWDLVAGGYLAQVVITTRLRPELRAYRSPDDSEATFGVFQAAIRQTAVSSTGPTGWKPGPAPIPPGPPRADLSSRDARRRPASTLVAVVDDTVVGFTDLLPDGLVDMLFVHPRTGGARITRA